MSTQRLLTSLIAIALVVAAFAALAVPARAATEQDIDFVSALSVACNDVVVFAGIDPALKAPLTKLAERMACGRIASLSPKDLAAARAAPTAITRQLGFDPTKAQDACDAAAALIDSPEAAIILSQRGANSPFKKALGNLEQTCGLPNQSTRQIVLSLCSEVRARPTPSAADLEEFEKLKGKKTLTKQEKSRLNELETAKNNAEEGKALQCERYATATPSVAEVRGKPPVTVCSAAKGDPSPQARKLATRCDQFLQASGVTDILVPAIQGLGDFLEAQAKQELVQYAMTTLGRALCTADSGHTIGAALLQNTCKVLFPKKKADGSVDYDQPNLDAISGAKFGPNLEQDLLQLAPQLLPVLLSPEVTVKIKDGPALLTILQAVVDNLQKLQKTPVSAMAFLQGLEHTISGQVSSLQCSFVDPKNPPSAPCVLMLYLSFAGKAGDAVDPTNAELGANIQHLNDWSKVSIIYYCQTYGVGHPTDVSGACLIGASAPGLWTALSDWQKGIGDFAAQLQGAIEKLNGDRTSGASLPTLAEDGAVIADAFAQFATELLDGAKAIDTTEKSVFERTEAILDLPALVLHASAAALGKDYPKLVSGVRTILASPALSDKMDPKFHTAILFFLDLSTAKDRASAQQMIQDAAAPLGSYKQKYAGQTMWALNGYVGILGGARRRFSQAAGISSDDQRAVEVVPLAAPVGFDVTWVPGPDYHFGLLLSLIDPLALDTGNQKGQVLNGVLAPGLFLRLGIARSPIVIMAGVRGQPLLESTDDTCGSDGKTTCWKGQLSGLLGVAVDVPILQLSR